MKFTRQLLGDVMEALRFSLCSPHSSMKVRWNSAYALSNLFQNTCIQLRQFAWTPKVMFSVANTLVAEPNFKVRIYAATALSFPSSQLDYGGHYQFTVRCVIIALVELVIKTHKQPQNEEFVGYVTSFEAQLINTLHHLINQVTM